MNNRQPEDDGVKRVLYCRKETVTRYIEFWMLVDDDKPASELDPDDYDDVLAEKIALAGWDEEEVRQVETVIEEEYPPS